MRRDAEANAAAAFYYHQQQSADEYVLTDDEVALGLDLKSLPQVLHELELVEVLLITADHVDQAVEDLKVERLAADLGDLVHPSNP